MTGPTIDPDSELIEQVALLIRRVENIERAAADDRTHVEAEMSRIRSDVTAVARHLEESTSAIERKAESMVLDTVRLQLLGLLLVGAGTVFLAIGAFVGP